jgi:AraC-like DNA-binding protein
MPDGCMDVIFDLTERRGAESAYIVGAMLEAQVFRHAGEMAVIGVRFAPGAAPLFLRTPAGELTASSAPARAVWIDADDLLTRLQETTSVQESCALLDAYLLSRLDSERAGAELAVRGMNAIERSRGLLTVKALREHLNSDERTLQRRFEAWVGLTPKQAMRIARFRHVLALLAARPRQTLARIAALCGYTDQAHLTKEFGSLARTTPAAYAHERGVVGFLQDRPNGPNYLAAEPLERSRPHEDESPDPGADG